jgi:hypothetical protein
MYSFNITFSPTSIQVQVADIFSSSSLQEAFAEQEAVISCLGPRGFSNYLPWATVDIYSAPMKPITEAIQKTPSMQKLVVLTGACTKRGCIQLLLQDVAFNML